MQAHLDRKKEAKMGNKRINEIQEVRSQVVPNGHASGTTCYVESAKGAIITDVEGNEYIDFAGGIAVMNVGKGTPEGCIV